MSKPGHRGALLPQTLTITRPDDWHIHLRDGSALDATVADVSRYFGRAIIMPNLVPPVRNRAEAAQYRGRIMEALSRGRPDSAFEPLMVLYLTDETTPADISDACQQGSNVFAAKLYPAGATTNSASGVTDIRALAPVLDAMQKHGLPLLIHGEVTHESVDVFDREKVFLEQTLGAVIRDFPELRVVLEHISTAEAVEFVASAGDQLGATITAHHLLFNRNDMLVGGIRPHYFCLPILKRAEHQQALLKAATSGNPKFFLGTDSAPHAIDAKENACGCAGCYTAHAAIELYAQAFEDVGALDRLEGFASHFGPDFYGLARNSDTITLQKETWSIPETLQFGPLHLRPMAAGESLAWQVVAQS